MRSYPNINFSDFSLIELCDFVTDRIAPDIHQLLKKIHDPLMEDDTLFKHIEAGDLLSIQFLRLEDECNQLLRLETLAFFPFVSKQVINGEKPVINNTITEKLLSSQELILTLICKIRLSMNNFLSLKKYSSIEQIIVNDFTTLESMLQDWILLVQNHIVNRINNTNITQNEYS